MDARQGGGAAAVRSAGSLAAAAAASSPTPAPAPGWRSLPAGLILHQAGAVASLAGQAILLVAQLFKAPTPVAFLAQAALLVPHVTVAFLVFKRPQAYWANRSWLLPLLRLALFSMPSFRRTGVGTALVLDRPPEEGALGAAKDWCRILLGTRLLSSAVGGLVLVGPPAATLVTQAVLTALISNAPAYCSSQLLAAPLTQRRMLGLAACLEYGTTPVALLMPLAVHAALGGAAVLEGTVDPGALCRGNLLFLNVFLGVVLPTLVSCLHDRDPPGQASRRGGGAAPRSLSARLLQRGSRLFASGNRCLRAMVDGESRRLLPAFLAWYTAVLLWWCARPV